MAILSIHSTRSASTDQSARAVELLARVFAGVSDPTRLRILLLLLERERNVSELVEGVGASQGRVSIHLQCLRWCGYVTSERRGKYMYYRIADLRVHQLIQLAQDLVVLHGEQLATCAVLGAKARREELNESL